MNSNGNNCNVSSSRKKGGRKSRNNRKKNRKGTQYQAVASGAIARPFPAKFRVRMTYQNGEPFLSSTKVVRGLSEFLAKPPMFYNYLFGIYKYCRVLAVELEVHWASTGTDASRVAIGRVPYSDTSGITYSQFCEMPETQTAMISAKGGIDRLVQRQTFVPRSAAGEVLTDHSYWVNSAQAISATPLHNDDYVILIMSDGVGVAAASSAVVKLHYHVEWFELQYAV